jgi:predicted nucleic acid-binding protein
MPDNAFVDSNIIIYAYSVDEPKKQAIARELLNTHEMIFISTQTINEFVNVTTRKKMLNNSQIAEVIDELFSVFSVETIGQNIIQKALVLSKI